MPSDNTLSVQDSSPSAPSLKAPSLNTGAPPADPAKSAETGAKIARDRYAAARRAPGNNSANNRKLENLSATAQPIARLRKKNILYLNQFLAHPGDKGKPSPFQVRYCESMRDTFTVGGQVDKDLLAQLAAQAKDAERQFVAYMDKQPELGRLDLQAGGKRKLLSMMLSQDEKDRFAPARVAQAEQDAAQIANDFLGGARGEMMVLWATFRYSTLPRRLSDLPPKEQAETIRLRLQQEHGVVCKNIDDFIEAHKKQGQRLTERRYPHLTQIFNFGDQHATPRLYRRALRDYISKHTLNDVQFSHWVCGGAGGDDKDPSGTALAQLTKCDLALSSKDVKKDSYQSRDYLNRKMAELTQLKKDNKTSIEQAQKFGVSGDELRLRNALVAELERRNTAIDALHTQLDEILNSDSISRDLSTLYELTAMHVLNNKLKQLRALSDEREFGKRVPDSSTFRTGSAYVAHSPSKLKDVPADKSRSEARLDIRGREAHGATDHVENLDILADKSLSQAILDIAGGKALDAAAHVKNLDIRDVGLLRKEKKEEMRRWVSERLNEKDMHDGYRFLGRSPPCILEQDWQAAEEKVLAQQHLRKTVRRTLVANQLGDQKLYSTETVPAALSDTVVGASYKWDGLQGVTASTPLKLIKGQKTGRFHAPNLLLHRVWEKAGALLSSSVGKAGALLSSSVGVDNLDSVKIDKRYKPSEIRRQMWKEVLNLAFEAHLKSTEYLPREMVHVDVRLSKQGDGTSRVAAGCGGQHKLHYKHNGRIQSEIIQVSPICFNFAVNDLDNTERERENAKNMTALIGNLDPDCELGGKIGDAIRRCKEELPKMKNENDVKHLKQQIDLLEEQGREVRQMFCEGRHQTGQNQAYAMSAAVLSLVSRASQADLAAGSIQMAFTSSHVGSVEQGSHSRSLLNADTIQRDMEMLPNDPNNPDAQATAWLTKARGDKYELGMW